MKINLSIPSKENDLYLSTDSKREYFERFNNTINNSKYGFFNLPLDSSHINEAKELFETFNSRKNFVQIGIGGSALGPQMLVEALGKNKDRTFLFLDNTDAEHINDQLASIDLKNSLFYVVSKSGGTAETIASFIICYNSLLDAGVSKDDMDNYFVFSTDPTNGELRELANKEGFKTLPVPSNIGGRFSILSSVGLFPALFAGIKIEKLYEGALKARTSILEDKENSSLLDIASTLMTLNLNNINQTILMPYSSKLKSLSAWFVQLWGESLGKIDKNGKAQGLTPIAAYGATDQHAQMQLFMEGKNDKFLMLLQIMNKSKNYELKNDIDLNAAKKLSAYDLNSLIDAQLKGTLKALKDRNRNTAHICIDANDELAMGEMILFFESLTVLMGHYLEVDPFDQPGVELGKKYAFEYLNS